MPSFQQCEPYILQMLYTTIEKVNSGNVDQGSGNTRSKHGPLTRIK